VAEQFAWFENNKILAKPGQMRLRTNEGKKAWTEAMLQLSTQPELAPFEWSDALALAAKDHCLDTAPSEKIGHVGVDGSSMKDRINRYGDW